jgi:predicted TPR repeat methyltransferase
MKGSKVGQSYQNGSIDDTQKSYDAWAGDYESDLMAMGYRLPWVFAAICVRYLDGHAGPILDVGRGGGLQAEPLRLMGWDTLEAADLSVEMLNIARSKILYRAYHQIRLGEPLPFADGSYQAVLSCGVITPGHAPPEALDELVRITASAGLLIFTMRDDPEQNPAYPARLDALLLSGAMKEIFRTDPFASLPTGEPDVRHRVHVCEVP